MDLREGREVSPVRIPENMSLTSIEPVRLMLSRLDGDDTPSNSGGSGDTAELTRFEKADRSPSSSTTQGSADDSRDHPGPHRHRRKVGDTRYQLICRKMPTRSSFLVAVCLMASHVGSEVYEIRTGSRGAYWTGNRKSSDLRSSIQVRRTTRMVPPRLDSHCEELWLRDTTAYFWSHSI